MSSPNCESGGFEVEMIRTKRVYEPVELENETRILLDRLWPRGIDKKKLGLDFWCKVATPASQLSKWFSHYPGGWDEFRRCYFAEPDSNPAAWSRLPELARSRNITPLYSARDGKHNNAEALRDYLESKLQQ